MAEFGLGGTFVGVPLGDVIGDCAGGEVAESALVEAVTMGKLPDSLLLLSSFPKLGLETVLH